jgi:hypothetical protein
LRRQPPQPRVPENRGVAGSIPALAISSPVRVTQVGANGYNYPMPGGAFSGTFPLLGLSKGEQPFTLVAADNFNNVAQATGREAAFTAKIKPANKQGKPRPRREVKITLEGWLGKTVYIHYMPPFPKRKSVKTRKVGKTKKPCGKLTKRFKHLFPFKPKPGGSWQVVFDTHRKNINYNATYLRKNLDKNNNATYISYFESVGF